MKVIIRTKRIDQYFSGEIINGYFPFDARNYFYVSCNSFAGGGRKVSLLDVLDYKEKTKTALIEKLKKFANRNKLIIEL